MVSEQKIDGSDNILIVLESNGEVVDVLNALDMPYNIRKGFYGHSTFSKTCMTVMKKVLDSLDLVKYDRITALLVCSVKVAVPEQGYYREPVKVRKIIYDRR